MTKKIFLVALKSALGRCIYHYPRVQEKQQVKGQQSCILVFVVCLTIPSSNQRHQPRRDNSIPYMSTWMIYTDTEQPQEKETSQKRKSNLASQKMIFPQEQTHSFSHQQNNCYQTSQTKPALKSTSHFLPQSTVSCRSDSSSEANSSYCHRSNAWSHLE